MANEDPLRVWQEQPVEGAVLPLEEIRRRAGKFENRIRNRDWREYIAAAVVLAAFTFYLFWFSDLVMRAGSAMVIAGTIYVVVQLYRRSAPAAMPAEFGLTASVEFYRGELVRQRDLLRSVWKWYLAPFVPGLVVISRGKLPFLVINTTVFGLVWWVNQRGADRLTRQIEELDRLGDE
jgi:hypothetical protein